MNILFSCDEYPPAKTGGIGSVTKTVAEGLSARGHNIYVVSGRLPGHGLPAKKIINGVLVYRITYFRHWGTMINNRWIIHILTSIGFLSKLAEREINRTHKYIEELISMHHIDLVEIPDYTILTKYYNTRKFIPFKPFSSKTLARVHGSKSFLSYFKAGKISSIGLQNDSDFFNKVDGISSVSKFSADFLRNKLGINRPIHVIYNPLDFSALREESTQNIQQIEQQAPYIFFLGKIKETKGAYSLIRAFNIFSYKHPNYRLLLAGGGEIAKAQLLVDVGIKEKVTFLGYVAHAKLMTYIRKSAFCVIPSYYENFSMAALEVMSMGKALVYTRETSGPEIIEDGIDGILVNPRDSDEISRKMCVLAENASERNSIEKKAVEKITNNFSIDVILDQLEKFYNQTIHS